jgi:type I restriction enzyme S subunit
MERYDLYKDSRVQWIGEIPNSWNLTKMKHVGNYINGYPFKPSDWGDSGRLIIRIQNLTKGRGTENFYDGEIDSKYIVKRGDYLFSWSTTLGLFEWKGEEGVLNQHIFKVELNEVFTRKFYYWVIQGVIPELSNESHGSTMTHLTKGVFGNIRLPIPPLSEQQQIVSFLDTKTSLIDSLIVKTQRKIELLKEKRTYLINEIVTKGLNPNVEMKDSGVGWIGKIPSNWDFVKLKQLFFINKRISGELGYDVLSVTQKGLKVKDLENNKGQHSMDYSKYQFVYKNDFVMNHMDLLTGYVDLSEQIGVTSPDYRVFTKSNERVHNKFYLYIFQLCYIRKIFYGLGRGVSNLGRWRLPSVEFLNMYLPFPNKDEQQQIVEYLDEQTQLIDKTISIEEKRIELLKEYRQSLISEVVTGKRKVVEDNYPIIKNSLSVTLPYKILNPKYEKKVFKSSSGETITTQTGEEYLKPKKELIDFLNKELSNLVTTKNQKDSIERFF